MYELKKFDKVNGYEISFEELSKIIDAVFPEKQLSNGWYQVVVGNLWEKDDKKRNYLYFKEYRNRKPRGEHSLGYYDYVTGRYIITDRYKKVTDVIAKYQEGQA